MIKLYIIIPGKNGRQSCPAIDKDNVWNDLQISGKSSFMYGNSP